MHAITPLCIGKRVGARAIRPEWDLADGETFKTESWTPDSVLAEDGQSLRKGTLKELEKPA